MQKFISDLSIKFNLSPEIINEYLDLFKQHKIPFDLKEASSNSAKHILMISTHGYWELPPPTGLPDTGGQTYYVLEVSKAWAKLGKRVIIIARWFEPYPRIESFAKDVWLIRVRAGHSNFLRKEDIYPQVPVMAEASIAIGALFNADAVVGHYADGMAGAVETAERLNIPAIVIPHSMGIKKVENLGFDEFDPETWVNKNYNFWIRESFELNSLRGANFEIANTSQEPDKLKQYYNEEFPHIVMQAGAGEEFFEAAETKTDKKILKEFDLKFKNYMIFFGRISEAKNVPQTVAVLGELKNLDQKKFKKFKLVIAGGSRHHLLDEERKEEEKIHTVMNAYNLNTSDVVRIYGHLDRSILTNLIKNSLAYIGMQTMEPFGMGVAEAMATKTPAIISSAAGITKWLKPDIEAIIVDPNDAKECAKKIYSTLKIKRAFEKIANNGYERAKSDFSWEGIARSISKIIDELANKSESDTLTNDITQKIRLRGFHRNSTIWIDADIDITDNDKKIAREILLKNASSLHDIDLEKSRKIISISDFAVPAERQRPVAEYLKFLIRKENMWAEIIDISINDDPMLHEELLDKNIRLVHIRTKCKILKDKIYDIVPVKLSNISVVLVITDKRPKTEDYRP